MLNNRNSMSGIRAPVRYSTNLATQMTRGCDKSWTLKATYVEIYNEQLRDLLVPEHIPMHERSQVSIREDTRGHIILTGLNQVEINSVGDLLGALNFGSMIRQTDSTAINAKSSRSHAVFSLNLVQRRGKQSGLAEKRLSVPLEAMTGAETMVTIDSKLHFVDLAGSERLKNTGAQGDRAKEGISINAGLASLGKVISQLSSRQAGSHVSYRDSKLTRLLQDSLGGNAITYMIACVTPAEFHLSETLNTVQYAQRARAIQSKPRIQQISDESDKQALIDRLKAEVAFLRDQIRSSERGGDRRTNTLVERPERHNEREIELQNQLLDIQENYTSLSQRHARLISEMAKARDGELAENKAMEETLGDSATQRLMRSNSFAEAVDQVVLEYEKTIESLEQSLSSTRSSLSSTETALLERETKCAYVETVNQQLQARLQKIVDRELSTENYLHDLELKLEGHTSGEEKNSALVLELRKEIARVRENEANCEDYISTLEERLAEADQDAELMQREIDRLEHVVERQRSLGKLDNLLYELDHIQQNGKNAEIDASSANGHWESRAHSRSQSHTSRESKGGEHSDEDSESDNADRNGVLTPEAEQLETDEPVDNKAPVEESDQKLPENPPNIDYPPENPAQSKFVADKLEDVTQELFDLRVEHESTLNEFDLLSAKYEEALRTLAELQDAVDEARHPTARDSIISASTATQARPESFLADAGVNELRDGAGQYLSSRSLSSELSLAGELPSTLEASDAEAVNKKSHPSDAQDVVHEDETLAVEVEKLRQLAVEREETQRQLAERYEQLQEQHSNTLDIVEELKAEVQKARSNEATSPRSVSPVFRRKGGSNVMIDRAHRSFASLRNIATENFENHPHVMQNFESNLNTAIHELHTRSERVQELEAEITAVKKEMETKMTIISGLTRERSSMKNSSPMDMSFVSTMRDQLLQSENQVRLLQETQALREKELSEEIATLQTAISERTLEAELVLEKSLNEQKAAQDSKLINLEAELVNWERRHEAALSSMQVSEKQFLATIADLESQISILRSVKIRDEQEHDTDSVDHDLENSKQQDLIDSLQREIDEHRATVDSNAARIVELEQAHSHTKEQFDLLTQSRDDAVVEIQVNKDLISKLEQQITEHENIVLSHRDNLTALHASHAEEIEEIKATASAGHEALLADLAAEHQASLHILEEELTEARDSLSKVATQVAFALGVEVSVGKIEDRISELVGYQKAFVEEQEKSSEYEAHVIELSKINDTIMRELETVKSELSNILPQSADARLRNENVSVSERLEAVKEAMVVLEAKNKKNSRLVGELEDQLATNFDQHQMATNRLSTLQTERNVQLEEANSAHARAMETIKEEYAALQVYKSLALYRTWTNVEQAKFDEIQTEPIDTKRSNSLTNSTAHLRKSPSVVSLPSPPPVIPLPPIPAGASVSPTAANVPIPMSPNSVSVSIRPSSKDLAIAQIQEDQEARIRTIEKHLTAEKQLTATLEEALTDLERQSNKVKADCDAWRRRAADLELEVKDLRNRPQQENRWSISQVEEERKKRKDAEIARAHLEERMNAINKKKKKGSLNCF